jgi:opacity protein-like surface antigen
MKIKLAFLASATCAALLCQSAALAQATSSTTSNYDASRKSWLPYTNNGYIGLNVGRPRYSTPCGNTIFNCDDPSASFNVYAGGMFNSFLGAEIGYLHMGDADRAGGTTRAQGINLSLVGRVPVSSRFSVFGKLGTTYGRTRTGAAAGSGITGGRDSGWGEAYGLGASFDFTNNWSAVLEWQRHRFHFAGDQRDFVRTTSLGVKYRF